MTRLREHLAQILVEMGANAKCVANPVPTNGTTLSRWDEALTACLNDDNACKYLDYLGPRR